MSTNKTATSFLTFVDREGITNKNGLLRAERFDAEYSNYELADNVFILTRHNGTIQTITALELFGKCQLPSQLPAGEGKIDSALDGKASQRKEPIAKEPKTARQALMRDIRASFESNYKAAIAAAKEQAETPNHISDELLSDYYNIVAAGKQLVIDGITVDTNNTQHMIKKEKLASVITDAENCFSGINGVDVTVEPNDDYTQLAIMAQHFDAAHQAAVDSKLRSLFGKAIAWQVIAAFKTAIITVKLPSKQA